MDDAPPRPHAHKEQNLKKRTFDVLPKPDKLIRYRQRFNEGEIGKRYRIRLTALLVERYMRPTMSKDADSIRRGLEEALVYAEGTADLSRYGAHVPVDIDVKAIRTRLNMTQEEFAARFGFSINTLRRWEQGRRVPEGPTRAYLLVIDRDPKAVQKALGRPHRTAA
jgi:putative transcriptional regulator